MFAGILAATDLSDPAQAAVERAALLAVGCGAPLALLHVHSGDEASARQRLQAVADALQQRHGIDCSLHLAAGDVLEALCAHAEALDAGLLVLGARGTGLVHDLLLGNTAGRLIERMRRPLLVVRHPADAPYRRPLLPVDFSDCSQRAVGLAHQLLPQVPLTLLHAFELPFETRLRRTGVDSASLLAMSDDARAAAARQMQQLLEDSGLAGDLHTGLVRHGTAVAQVLEQLREGEHDLLVVCRQPQSALMQLLRGRVSAPLLMASGIDTLLA